MNCQTCGNILSGQQTKFCSRKCKNKNSNFRHQNYACQQKRGIQRKTQFIKQLGGKCSTCGYHKNLSALEFHHQYGKDFRLDIRTFSNHNIKSLETEINKCIVLCAICHRELHHPSFNDWDK